MATFPSDVQCVLGTYSEDRAPVVLRSDMERGLPKQRRMASDTLVAVQVTLQFKDAAHNDAFEAWFDSQAGSGANFFTWVHPRTGTTVQARIVGGKLGPLAPLHGTWRAGRQRCRRDATFEYLRSTY